MPLIGEIVRLLQRDGIKRYLSLTHARSSDHLHGAENVGVFDTEMEYVIKAGHVENRDPDALRR